MAKQDNNFLDVEMVVMGALLTDDRADVWKEIINSDCGELTAGDFSDGRIQVIFLAWHKLLEKNSVEPDVLAVLAVLREKKCLAKAGGDEFVANICDIACAAVNAPIYAGMIVENANKRRVINSYQKAMNIIAPIKEEAGADDMPMLAKMNIAEAAVLQVSEDLRRRRGFSGMVAAGDSAKKVYTDILNNINENNFDQYRGLATGFDELDDATQGLRSGELIILAARPGCGKTAFAIFLSVKVLGEPGRSVGFFSLEMPAEQVSMRLLSCVASVDSRHLRSGGKTIKDDTEAIRRLAAAVGKVEGAPFFIEDNSQMNVLDIRSAARALARRQRDEGAPLAMVVVDYLQLVPPDPISIRKGENRAAEVSYISSQLKAMAKELKIPVLALAQLNRGVETRALKKLQLSDLRESGAIEQDADMVFFLQDGAADDSKSVNKMIDFVVAKNRHGRVGFEVKMMFKRNINRFLQVQQEEVFNG